MIQRLIGVGLGALITYVYLFVTKPGVDGGDPSQGYLVAVLLGAIVSALWPWVIGLYFARRARDRREDEIQKEVERQLAEKS